MNIRGYRIIFFTIIWGILAQTESQAKNCTEVRVRCHQSKALIRIIAKEEYNATVDKHVLIRGEGSII